MGEVLPLCNSPRSLFLCTAAFYQEVRQSLRTVGSSLKKFRWASPGPNGRSPGGVPLVVGDDIWWVMFGFIPVVCVVSAFILLTGDAKGSVICTVLKVIFMAGSYLIHFVLLFSLLYWYRDMPFQLIGAEAKFMVEIIPMITAAALHHLLAFNYGYLAIVLGCSTYIYVFAHFMHIAYDIGGQDVLVGLLMQVLVYMLDGGLLVRALTLSLCFSLCLYRYRTYCAPEVPAHGKKELERAALLI